MANFLYNLKTTYDPLHVGLRNLATDQNPLTFLLYSLDLLNHIDIKFRETIGNIYSQLHQVFFVSIPSSRRQVYYRLHRLWIDRNIFNHSYPIIAQTGLFECLH